MSLSRCAMLVVTMVALLLNGAMRADVVHADVSMTEHPAYPVEKNSVCEASWSHSDDYLTVTVNGKPHQNYVLLMRIGDNLFFANMAAPYLTQDSYHAATSPDDYFGAEIRRVVQQELTAAANSFPNTELVAINGQPWQSSEFASFYQKQLPEFIMPSLRSSEFYADPNNNGYALAVGESDLTEAQIRQPLHQMRVISTTQSMVRDSCAFAAMGGSAALEMEGFRYIAFEYQGFPHTQSVVPLDRRVTIFLNSTKTYVTNHLGDQFMNALDVTELSVAPIAPRGRTLVPVRGLFEAFGATVEWIGETNQVQVVDGPHTILLTIGSEMAMVNGRSVQMIEPAALVNSRTMIPLRFVSENLGYTVAWDEETKRIEITKPAH